MQTKNHQSKIDQKSSIGSKNIKYVVTAFLNFFERKASGDRDTDNVMYCFNYLEKLCFLNENG